MFRLFAAVFRSLYDPSLYRDAGKAIPGGWFGYLCVAVVVAVVPFYAVVHAQMAAFARDEGPFIASQIPTITVDQGVAKAVQEGAVRVATSKGEPILLVDTARKAKIPADFTSGLVLTSHTLSLRYQGTVVESLPLARFESFTITAEKVARLFERAPYYLLLGLLPTLLVMGMGSALSHLIITALFAMWVLFVAKRPASFGQAVRLSAVVITPALLVDSWLRPFMASPETTVLMVICAYLYFGVQSQKPVSR
jgi:hypothetical protein